MIELSPGQATPVTHAAYRRRGLGAVACARTILEGERRGRRIWWNTSPTNPASAGPARKLGSRTERRSRVLGWSTSPAAEAGEVDR